MESEKVHFNNFTLLKATKMKYLNALLLLFFIISVHISTVVMMKLSRAPSKHESTKGAKFNVVPKNKF